MLAVLESSSSLPAKKEGVRDRRGRCHARAADEEAARRGASLRSVSRDPRRRLESRVDVEPALAPRRSGEDSVQAGELPTRDAADDEDDDCEK